MEEGLTCECGHSTFWVFWDKIRCPECHNEYKKDGEELWMRRFNKEDHFYPGNWEHWNYGEGAVLKMKKG